MYPLNKGTVAHRAAQKIPAYQELMKGLSLKELRILQKHPDLIDRLSVIAKMTFVQLLAELKNEHNLEVDMHDPQEFWVNVEKLVEAIPSWFSTEHCGWTIDPKPEELSRWAKDFLMQEVRINIWLRYYEHKKATRRPWSGTHI